MYADGSPRYEARETCPDAILYHKVSTLEPHPTGLPVYVVPFKAKYRDKYRYNTFPLQQEENTRLSFNLCLTKIPPPLHRL